jgi:hypothetical protein
MGPSTFWNPRVLSRPINKRFLFIIVHRSASEWHRLWFIMQNVSINILVYCCNDSKQCQLFNAHLHRRRTLPEYFTIKGGNDKIILQAVNSHYFTFYLLRIMNKFPQFLLFSRRCIEKSVLRGNSWIKGKREIFLKKLRIIERILNGTTI